MKLLRASILLLSTAVKVTAQSDTSCPNDEALVEISVVTKSANVTTLSYGYSFSLTDTTSNNVTFECIGCEFVPQEFEGDYPDSFTTYESKACVPKDHCHRFLIGTTKERWGSTRIIDDFESFTLNWDGESLLENFNAYSFDRIDFGQCESKCSSDQSEFEFFIARNQSAYMDGLSWNLTGSDGAELYADSAPDNTASLVHAIECVAKDDCVKFGIGYPIDDETFYSVRLGNVMYADGKLVAPYPAGKALHMGGCKSSDVCSKGDTWFEAQLNFKDTFSKNGTDYYALGNGEVNWLLFQEDGNGDYYYDDFDGYSFGESYAVGQCIPADKCSQFAINTRVIEGLDSYIVSEGGSELTERVTRNDGDEADFADYSFEGTTTTGTSSCPSDVWGDDEGSAAPLHIKSMFAGLVALAVTVLHV